MFIRLQRFIYCLQEKENEGVKSYVETFSKAQYEDGDIQLSHVLNLDLGIFRRPLLRQLF